MRDHAQPKLPVTELNDANDDDASRPPAESGQQSVGLPDVRLGIRLLARLARLAERTCLESGISLPQYRLLISASGSPQRASELAESVGVSRPTLTSLVDGLEEAGLVKRVPEPTDRRGIRLELTEAGRDAAKRAEEALANRLLTLFGDRAQEIVETLRAGTLELVEVLDQERRNS